MSEPRYIQLCDDPDEPPCPVLDYVVLDHRFVVTVNGKRVLDVSVRQAVLLGMSRGGDPETRLDLSV